MQNIAAATAFYSVRSAATSVASAATIGIVIVVVPAPVLTTIGAELLTAEEASVFAAAISFL